MSNVSSEEKHVSSQICNTLNGQRWCPGRHKTKRTVVPWQPAVQFN